MNDKSSNDIVNLLTLRLDSDALFRQTILNTGRLDSLRPCEYYDTCVISNISTATTDAIDYWLDNLSLDV